MSKDVEFKGTTPEQEAAFMRGMGRSPDHPIDPYGVSSQLSQAASRHSGL